MLFVCLLLFSVLSTLACRNSLSYGKNPPLRLKVSKLLVHYSYFEDKSVAHCELLMKRVNLATFVKGAVALSDSVTFVFTLTGKIPTAAVFFHSIGLDVPAHGKILPPLENVRVHRGRPTHRVPDLCHHSQVMKNLPIYRSVVYDYVLFMNDGVRGPLLEESTSTPVNDRTGLPVWLSQLSKMMQSSGVAAVAPVLSCERDIHLQGWYVLVKSEVVRRLSLHKIFMKTCASTMTWDEAIDAEVNFSRSILDHGLSIAALYPVHITISAHERRTLRDGGDSILRRTLSDCQNPFTVAKERGEIINFTDMSAVKLGGNFLRADIFSLQSKKTANVMTETMLGKPVGQYLC